MKEKPQSETEDSLLTRRQVVASLAATGAIGTAGATLQSSEDETTANVGIGGGPMSDEASHLTARVYRGPADELPDPGVEDRFFHVTTGNAEWDANTLLADTGSAWEKQSLEVESLSTEQVNNIEYVTPDQDRTIQDAVDALPAAGGVVELSAGLFQEPTQEVESWNEEGEQWAIVALRKNVWLRGQGPQTVLKLEDNIEQLDANHNVIAHKDMTDTTTDSRMVVSDLTIDGNYANQDPSVQDTESGSGVSWEGIDFMHTEYTWVERVHIRDTISDGYDVDDATENWIINCQIQDTGTQSIHVTQRCDRSFVIGNSVERAATNDPSTRPSITLFGDASVASNNTIVDGSGIAISVNPDAGDDFETGCVISNNRIIEPGSNGVTIHSPAKFVNVSDNVISGAGNHGIRVTADVTDCLILNNSVNSCASGVRLDSNASRIKVSNNQLKNNSDRGISGYGHGANCSFTGNTIQGNGDFGILVYNAIGPTLVSGNTMEGNAGDTFECSVGVDDAHSTFIIANSMDPETTRAVDVEATSSDTVIRNNQFVSGGVVIDAGTTAQIYGNYPTQKIDVTNLQNEEGSVAYNDGGANDGSDGYAFYDGSNWANFDTTTFAP